MKRFPTIKPAKSIKPVICITGPTASGKSGLAVRLAKQVSGEVINADALQVYRDLRVISARPNAAEMGGVPHHLFGHIDGAHRYSTGQWLREVETVILDVLARGHVPIVVGGTGLYFKALTEGLAQVPPVTLDKAKAILEREGIAGLRATAEALDPTASARVLGNDPQRLLRIVSVAQHSGRTLSAWQQDTKPLIPKGYWYGVAVVPPREALYSKINSRFDTMVEDGGLDEVRALVARGLSPDLPVMRAIGVKTVAAHLAGGPKSVMGEHDLTTGIELAKRDTRRFAKRQMTWLRGQAKDWPILQGSTDKAAFCKTVITLCSQ